MGLAKNIEEFYDRVSKSRNFKIIISDVYTGSIQAYVYAGPGSPRIVFHGGLPGDNEKLRRLLLEAFDKNFRSRRTVYEEAIGSAIFTSIIVLFMSGILSNVFGNYILIAWIIIGSVFYVVVKYVLPRLFKSEKEREALPPGVRMKFALLFSLITHVLAKKNYICKSKEEVLSPSPLGGYYRISCEKKEELTILALRKPR